MEINLSIVIPAYNEARRLELCLINTLSFTKKQNYLTEVIIVDDGSEDNTFSVAESFKYPNNLFDVIRYEPNMGKGYAVKTGVMRARGKYILFMDADYAVSVYTATEYLDIIEKDYDMVIASRGHQDTVIKRHQWYPRELAGKMFGRFQKLVLDIPFKDTQCGFKLFKNEIAKKLFSKVEYNCSYFDAEIMYMAHRMNLKIYEAPVVWGHDGITRMPIGPSRIVDLFKKLFRLKKRKIDNDEI